MIISAVLLCHSINIKACSTVCGSFGLVSLGRFDLTILSHLDKCLHSQPLTDNTRYGHGRPSLLKEDCEVLSFLKTYFVERLDKRDQIQM